MKVRNVACLLVLLACCSGGALAGGPVYTRFAIGDLLWFGSSRAWALGGPGYALRGPGFVNTANPAGLSGLRFTRFDGAYGFTSYASEAGGAEAPYSISRLQGIAIGIPVDTAAGVVMSLDLSPYSSVGYSLTRRDDQSGVRSTQSIFGRGGLSSISLGLSARAAADLHTGVRVSYIYGRLRQFTSIDFDDITFVDDEVDRSEYYSGFLLTVGTILEAGRAPLGLPLPGSLSLALVAQLPSRPTIERINAYRALDTLVQSTHTGEIPLRIGIGARLTTSDQSSFVADAALQDWSGVAATGASLRTALRVSAGYELLPRPGDQSFFGRLAYRVGAGFQQTYLRVSGTGIDDMFAVAGLGIPISPTARLSASFMAGVRGTTDGGLQKDTYLQFTIGITGSELWFVSFDEE